MGKKFYVYGSKGIKVGDNFFGGISVGFDYYILDIF